MFEIYQVNADYVGTYIVFFLFTPFLNLLIHAMNKKQYQCLLVLTLVLYTGYSTFFFHQTYNYLVWLMVMYLVGGFFSKYPVTVKKPYKCLVACLGFTLVNFIFCSGAVVLFWYLNR